MPDHPILTSLKMQLSDLQKCAHKCETHQDIPQYGLAAAALATLIYQWELNDQADNELADYYDLASELQDDYAELSERLTKIGG